MSKILTVNYDTRARIETFKIDKFPIVIITDSHTNIKNIEKIKNQVWPNTPIYCLGDITFLYSQKDASNRLSIQYFIDNKIPCLKGNHDEFITSGYFWDWDINIEQIKYLCGLPIGFKFVLPDGTNYLAYHNFPHCLWSFRTNITEREFLEFYPIDDRTIGVLKGHEHRNNIQRFKNTKCCLINIGRLSKDGDYALLLESGIEFKSL